MHIIKKISIKKFRAFENIEILLDRNVIAIAGQNGAMKTTLLGMLAQPFSLATKGHQMFGAKTIEGAKFGSDLQDKFKFSPKFDPIGSHEWTLTVAPDIYVKQDFTCVSIDRNTGKRDYDLRFWSNDKSRKAGTGYIQCPVVFLSLKRLLPLGEIVEIKEDSISLNESEIAFYKEWHNKILISTDSINSVHHLSAKDKSSLGPETSNTDALTISSGQDNIGRIILAVLSFGRLKNQFPEAYKGGMIFIDEVETTLYPAAQIKLLEFMFKEASQLNLQFFFTTHSKTILEYLKKSKYSRETALIYLKKRGNLIESFPNLSWAQIDAHLTMDLLGSSILNVPKIKVYGEDVVAFAFLQKLLSTKLRTFLDFQRSISLSSGHYKALLEKNVSEFTNNIVMLDGDMKRGANKLPARFINRFKNLIFLPGVFFPEKLLFDELWNLPDDDDFWAKEPGGYDKQKCFINISQQITDKNEIKTWFSAQEKYIGKNCARFISFYIKRHPQECNDFCCAFLAAYNFIAEKTGFYLLSEKEFLKKASVEDEADTKCPCEDALLFDSEGN